MPRGAGSVAAAKERDTDHDECRQVWAWKTASRRIPNSMFAVWGKGLLSRAQNQEFGRKKFQKKQIRNVFEFETRLSLKNSAPRLRFNLILDDKISWPMKALLYEKE